MDYNIFKTEKEKAHARKVLPGLIEHPGWPIVVKALELNAAFVAEQLKEKKDFTSLAEVYALQDRIDDLEQYKKLPQNILAEIPIEQDEEDTEIYDSPS